LASLSFGGKWEALHGKGIQLFSGRKFVGLIMN
jgi:hypothetical protein